MLKFGLMLARTSNLFPQSKLPPPPVSRSARTRAGHRVQCNLKLPTNSASCRCASIYCEDPRLHFPNGSTSVSTKRCMTETLYLLPCHRTNVALMLVLHPSSASRFRSSRVASRPQRTRAVFHEKGPKHRLQGPEEALSLTFSR